MPPTDINNLTPNDPGLLQYLLVLAKNKKLILFTTFSAAVLAAIYSLTLPNIYTAKTMILPGDEDKGIMGAMLAQIGGLGGLGGLAGGALGGATKADLYVTMLRSDVVKDQVIDKLNLMQRYKAKLRADAYKALDLSSKIAVGKKDGVITIAVDNKDPKLAADLANAYVDELGKFAAGLGMAGAGSNRAFLEKRLAEAKVDLARAEDSLKAFQARNKVISAPEQVQATIGGIAQLRAQLAVQETQLSMLRHQFADTSLEMKNVKSVISSLRSQLASLEGDRGGSSIPSAGSIPQLGQDYVRLMREFKIQEAVLELLTKQYEMVKINEVKDVAPFQIIQRAKVPEQKSKPFRSKIVLAVASVTFLLTVILVNLSAAFGQMSEAQKAAVDELKSHIWFFGKNKSPGTFDS